jgi:hypothetical protein
MAKLKVLRPVLWVPAVCLCCLLGPIASMLPALVLYRIHRYIARQWKWQVIDYISKWAGREPLINAQLRTSFFFPDGTYHAHKHIGHHKKKNQKAETQWHSTRILVSCWTQFMTKDPFMSTAFRILVLVTPLVDSLSLSCEIYYLLIFLKLPRLRLEVTGLASLQKRLFFSPKPPEEL